MLTASTYRFFVGIDISKLTLDICLRDHTGASLKYLCTANTLEGFKQLQDWLYQHKACSEHTVICAEHTGRYGEHLSDWFARSPWQYCLVITTALAKVRREHHRKDDQYDAALLAEYAWRYTDRLLIHKQDSAQVKQLKRLRKERRFMVDQRAKLRQKRSETHYHNADMASINECYQQQIRLLSDHINRIEVCIQELIASDMELSYRYKQLQSVPGIGKVIGCFWLHLFAGQNTLNPRKIASRFGFAPHIYRSGISVKGKTRSSKHGNSEMRRILHQAARSVCTHHPHFRLYYQRKLNEGKEQRLIMNNVINKIIRTACAVWNQKTFYDPNHISTINANFIAKIT